MGIRRFDGKESGIGKRSNRAILKQLEALGLGQHCPTHYPTQPAPSGAQSAATGAEVRLGKPIDIRQVARLIGCSPWTVRQTLLRKGLPHFRSGASSKLIFYEAQVVRWIERQQKGG
jgi:hypothetical protein